MPVQTQCRPLQHQCSVAVGNQHQKVMDIPTVLLFIPSMRESHSPGGFLLGGRGRIVGGSPVCVHSLERRNVY